MQLYTIFFLSYHTSVWFIFNVQHCALTEGRLLTCLFHFTVTEYHVPCQLDELKLADDCSTLVESERSWAIKEGYLRSQSWCDSVFGNLSSTPRRQDVIFT